MRFAIPFHCEWGTIVGKSAETFEVITTSGIRCIVQRFDRDEFGERFVDVPANWHHTDEERHTVVIEAQMCVDMWHQAEKRATEIQGGQKQLPGADKMRPTDEVYKSGDEKAC